MPPGRSSRPTGSPSTPRLRDEVVRARRGAGPAVLHGVCDAVADPVRDADGNVVDVGIAYPRDFTAQMLDYSARYSLRPVPSVGPRETT